MLFRGAAQIDQGMTSEYRESDLNAVRNSISRYCDVIHRLVCAVPHDVVYASDSLL